MVTRAAVPERPQIHPVTLLHNPYQQAFLKALAERTADGKRTFHRLAVMSGRRGGKALWIETELPTPQGWTVLRDIQVGDTLFDDTGATCRVTFATPVMHDHRCFRVTFSDGTQVIADADHQWTTIDKAARKAQGRPARTSTRRLAPEHQRRIAPKVVTTAEIAATLQVRGESNHAIPLAGPVQFPERALPLDPYFLGVWLGDGSSRVAQIHSADPEIIDALAQLGYASRLLVSQSGQSRCETYSFAIHEGRRNGTTGRFEGDLSPHSALRALNVLQNKHIPTMYLEASVAQRQALLEGLMDTDGTCDADGGCEYYSINERLAQDVCHLMQTLGFRPVLRRKRAAVNGKDCGWCYRVKVTPDRPIFRLARKRSRQSFRNRFNRFRFITAVEPYLSVPVRCLQVDAPSSQFLVTRACVPTHNTLIGALAAVREAAVPGTVGWACAPSYPQLHDYVIPAIRQFLPPELGSAKNKIWSESHMEFVLPWGSVIQCRSLDDPERGRGPGLHWCWIDEARGVTEKAWMTLLPALTDKPGVCWVTTTPNEYDWVYKTFYKPAVDGRPGYWACRYHTIDNPAIQTEEIADAKLSMTPEFYQQEYEADFVSFTGAVYGNTITPQVVAAGQERTLIPEWPALDPSRPAIVGLDMGTDHPFGAVLLVGTPLGYVAVGEYFARHQPLDTHIRQIRAMARGLTPRYVYDRTAQQLGIELAQQGFYAEPSNSDVLAGIRRVEAWLVSRKLWFLESAVPVTIQQHRAYRWAENTDTRGAARKERVYKVDDESCDCLRYSLLNAGELPEPAAPRTGRDPATVPEDLRWAWEREQRSQSGGWTHDEERGTGEFYL